MSIQPTHPASEVLRNFTPDGRLIPAYFWGNDHSSRHLSHPIYRGYAEARSLIGNGTEKNIANIQNTSLDIIRRIFATLDTDHDSGVDTNSTVDETTKTIPSSLHDGLGLVELRLSNELLAWKMSQKEQGRILPAKGRGLRRVSDEVISLLGAENWPAPMLTSNVLFGTVWSDLMIGAHDAETLYSNCCNDLGFYYEHGYDKFFPEFEPSIRGSVEDPIFRRTPYGEVRRNCVELGLKYIRGKTQLEREQKANLGSKMACLNRKAAHLVMFCEASLAGLAAETMARGYDPAACYVDMVVSSPGTDVVDVGSDLNNSEVMNSFLNTADITDSGVVTEEALRRVYDAYAAMMARTLTERWMEPIVTINSYLYTWEMLNDRHHYLRRIVLGYSKVRAASERQGQREADFEEAFDEHYHTTGFSRPLEGACDGRDTCSAVTALVAKAGGGDSHKHKLLSDLWEILVEEPVDYARQGTVDPVREEKIIKTLSLSLARCYHFGLILEQQWLVAHACHHGWQVNYLMEAAMFGSLLDDASLAGKLDRAD